MLKFFAKLLLGLILGTAAVVLVGYFHFPFGLVVILSPLAFFSPWIATKVLKSRFQPIESSQRLINPRRAFRETLLIPSSDRPITPSELQSLVSQIDQQLECTRNAGYRLHVVGDAQSTLCLSDGKERLYIWATLSSEIVRVRVDVSYAELNKGLWRGRTETNWRFEQSRAEAQRNEQNRTDEYFILFAGAVDAALGPKLSGALGDEADSLKQSFMACLGVGFERWRNEKSVTATVQTVTQEASANRQGGWFRD